MRTLYKNLVFSCSLSPLIPAGKDFRAVLKKSFKKTVDVEEGLRKGTYQNAETLTVHLENAAVTSPRNTATLVYLVMLR